MKVMIPNSTARSTRLPALALVALLSWVSAAAANPGREALRREAMPVDAYSLAQPEKLATPRSLQNSNSPLSLGRNHVAILPETLEPEIPRLAHHELLFLKPAAPDDLAPTVDLCIRENSAEALDVPLVLAPTAQVVSVPDIPAPDTVWYDPELAETAARAGDDSEIEDGRRPAALIPPPAKIDPSRTLRDPRALLNRGILTLERELAPEFMLGEDGEAMTPAEEAQFEEGEALPQNESASGVEGELFAP